MSDAGGLPILETVDGRVQLRDPSQPLINPIYVDFMSRDFQRRSREPRKAQLLAKALGLNARKPRPEGDAVPPLVVDATAGLGTDSALMAVWGCNVVALERSPLIFALLEDGLKRGVREGIKALEQITSLNGAAELYLADGAHAHDIVFVDPMYPDLKKAALPRKEMQILRSVLQPSTTDEVLRLLEAALGSAKNRVVVKRPPQAETLIPLGRQPNHSVEGKAVRYDIYLAR